MFKKFLKLFFIITIFVVTTTAEASTCNFTRDLKMGDKGEDVRCLQQYLNSTDSHVALSGAGSAGKETNLFREKTKEAVSLWQIRNGVNPAEGYFGLKSREKYNSLVESSIPKKDTTTLSVTPTTPTASNYSAIILDLNNQISTLKQELVNARNTTSFTGDQKKAADQIKKTIEMIIKAEDAIENTSKSTRNAEADIKEARNDFFDGIDYFFKNNYPKALSFAEDSYDIAEDVYKDLGVGDKAEAKKAIDEAKIAINEAEDEIEEAKDDDEDTDEAEDLLEEAKDLLRDARSSYSEEYYEDVIDLVDEIMDLIEDALDSL